MFVQSHIQRHHHHSHQQHHHHHHNHQLQHAGQHNRHHHAAVGSASRGQSASRHKNTDSGPVCEVKSSANFRCQPQSGERIDNRPAAAACTSAVGAGAGTEDGFHGARSNRAARVVARLASPPSGTPSRVGQLLTNQRAANVVKQQQQQQQQSQLTNDALLMNYSTSISRANGLVSGTGSENLAKARELNYQQQRQQATTTINRRRTRSVGSHKSVQVFDFMPRERNFASSGIEPTSTTISHSCDSRASAAQVHPGRSSPVLGRPALVSSSARRSGQADTRGSRIRLQRQESISDNESGASGSLQRLLAGGQQLLGELLQVPRRLATAAESNIAAAAAAASTEAADGHTIQGANSLQLLGLFCMSLISYQLETWHLLSKDLSREPMIGRRAIKPQGQQHQMLVRSATEQQQQQQQQHQLRLDQREHLNSRSELNCNQAFYGSRPIFEQSETFSSHERPASGAVGGCGEAARRDQKGRPAGSLLNQHNHPSYHRHSHSHSHRHHHHDHDASLASQPRASTHPSGRLLNSHSFEHYPAQWNGTLSNAAFGPNHSRNNHQSAQFAQSARDYRLVLCPAESWNSSRATGLNSNQMRAEFFHTGWQQHSFDDHDRAQSNCDRGNGLYRATNCSNNNNNNDDDDDDDAQNEPESSWIESCRAEPNGRPPYDETDRAASETLGSHLRPIEIATAAAANSINVDNYDSNRLFNAQSSNSHSLGSNRLTTTSNTKSIKKCSSSSKLSFEGARRRLGLKRKNESQLSSISVNRSEEIMPSEVRHLSRQTTFNSLNDSGTESGSFPWCGPSQQAASDPRIHFVEGLGEGQMASRQALVSPYLGDIQLSLCGRRGMLEIEVIRARHLHPKAGAKSLPSPYVKVYLIKGEKCIAKCKTHQVKQSLDPLYQKAFLFRHEFANCILQAIVWGEYGKRDRKSMMGIVQVNLDELDMSNLVIGWYKLFNISSMTSLLASSRILRQKMLHSSSMDESPPRGFD